jgi:hypothetical protein
MVTSTCLLSARMAGKVAMAKTRTSPTGEHG